MQHSSISISSSTRRGAFNFGSLWSAIVVKFELAEEPLALFEVLRPLHLEDGPPCASLATFSAAFLLFSAALSSAFLAFSASLLFQQLYELFRLLSFSCLAFASFFHLSL